MLRGEDKHGCTEVKVEGGTQPRDKIDTNTYSHVPALVWSPADTVTTVRASELAGGTKHTSIESFANTSGLPVNAQSNSATATLGAVEKYEPTIRMTNPPTAGRCERASGVPVAGSRGVTDRISGGLKETVTTSELV